MKRIVFCCFERHFFETTKANWSQCGLQQHATKEINFKSIVRDSKYRLKFCINLRTLFFAWELWSKLQATMQQSRTLCLAVNLPHEFTHTYKWLHWFRSMCALWQPLTAVILSIFGCNLHNRNWSITSVDFENAIFSSAHFV